VPLDVGIELGQEGIQVISVPGLDGAPDGLDILLRHGGQRIPGSGVDRASVRLTASGVPP